ncbi:MAG: AraC family transcriptional regulator [Clostridia bacterium]|nr:AraC family transcriptional regulator [Clostridia bacterium]
MKTLYRYNDNEISLDYKRDENPDPTAFTMHTHEQYEILYFVDGKAKYHIEGSEYPLNSGDLLIMRSNEAHYIELDPAQPYERLAIHFDTALLQKIDPDGLLLTPFRNRERGKNNLFTATDFPNENYLTYLLAVGNPSENQRLQVVSNLLALLNELYNAAEHRNTNTAPESTAYKIVQYVNTHLTEEMSIESICKQFYLSKPQLCRIFKRATGSTVWNYITIKRLYKAQRLIKRGTPTAQAADLSGFGDYTSFYRAYRKQFSSSPKDIK